MPSSVPFFSIDKNSICQMGFPDAPFGCFNAPSQATSEAFFQSKSSSMRTPPAYDWNCCLTKKGRAYCESNISFVQSIKQLHANTTKHVVSLRFLCVFTDAPFGCFFAPSLIFLKTNDCQESDAGSISAAMGAEKNHFDTRINKKIA